MEEEPTVFQNRIDSVGSLFQAGQQTFVYQAAGTSSRVPLHASLRQIDRTEQVEELVEVVGAARGEPRQKPLVVVLDGLAEDELLSFVQRLGEHGFANDMALPCDYLGHFDWPMRSVQITVNHLLGALSAVRGESVPTRSDAPNALAELVAGHGRSIAFAHTIDPADCRPEVLQAWAQLIAQTCTNPANGLLLCFLCIQRRKPAGRKPDWLTLELQALIARHGWCTIGTLPLIEVRHVEAWVTRYNLRPALADLDHIDPGVARLVFGRDPRLHYRDVIERLLDRLAPLLTPVQPRWAPER